MYTDFRPTPLQHYIHPSGSNGIFVILDEKGNFNEDNFRRATGMLQQKNSDIEYINTKKKSKRKKNEETSKKPKKSKKSKKSKDSDSEQPKDSHEAMEVIEPKETKEVNESKEEPPDKGTLIMKLMLFFVKHCSFKFLLLFRTF